KQSVKVTPPLAIYGSPPFCNTNFDEFRVCVNLSGVKVGKIASASMNSTPDTPKNPTDFNEPFCQSGFHQADRPLVSSIISLRKIRWVIMVNFNFNKPKLNFEYSVPCRDCPGYSGKFIG
ncbi:hypothetical protein, partial [Xenorhabdus szentirmaii]|uniref:hypothetical protein n=1 Tax=Xenorhabdus szentirmaii TaxID=290112 RepID=UPI002B415973